MSKSLYNPANGETFNYTPPQRLEYITLEEKLEALKRLDKLVEDTRPKLETIPKE